MYLPSVILLLSINCILGASVSSNIQGLKIIGGNTVDIHQFPYQVSVQVFQYHACGGSIVSKQYVITAAHCIIYPSSLYSVRAGSSYHASGGQVVKALSITPHPYYERITQNYDIAIIQLDGELSLGPAVDVISLPKEDEAIIEGTEAVVTGWGSTSRSYASQLQAVTLPVVGRERCASIYAHVNNMVNENMICAGYEGGGKDACQGDSGGPLVVNGKLFGLVSWGKGCGSVYPGVYTNVPRLRSFIRDITDM